MKNSKLIEVLKKLSALEIERFKAYMVSPYFIKQKSLCDFAAAILNEYPDFQESKIMSHVVYKEVFPHNAYKHQTLNDLMTLLLYHLRQFLAIENFAKDEIEKDLRAMKELRIRDIDKEFTFLSKKLLSKIGTGNKDTSYYFNMMRYENELEHFYILSKQHIGDADYLEKKTTALDTYYLALKLKLSCEMINRQNVFATDYSISMLEDVVSYVSNNFNTFKEVPAVAIYYQIILTLTKPKDENNFYALKEQLESHSDQFSNEELKELYAYAQNYCIKKINGGQSEYTRELFHLYKNMIESNLIYEKEQISQWYYKNIVSLGLRVHEYDWTAQFIDEQKKRIPIAFREMAWSHAMALYYYEKKEYSNAIKMLGEFNNALRQIPDSDFEDTFYILDSRSTLLKIYYELDEEELFRANIDSFKLFLNRNRKISDRQKTSYLNLIRYVKKINDIRQKLMLGESFPMKAYQELKNRIDNEQNIINQAWLQTQVEILGSKMPEGKQR